MLPNTYNRLELSDDVNYVLVLILIFKSTVLRFKKNDTIQTAFNDMKT